jgi:hypothetical protein
MTLIRLNRSCPVGTELGFVQKATDGPYTSAHGSFTNGLASEEPARVGSAIHSGVREGQP